MPILTKCSCGRDTWVGDQYAGKRVRCPACKEPMWVPDPNAALEVVEELEEVKAPRPVADPAPAPRQTTAGQLRTSGLLDAFGLPTGGSVSHLEFSRDCSYALASVGPLLHKIDLRNLKTYIDLPAHEEAITALATSPDGRHAASADRAGNILLWDMTADRPLRWLPGHDGAVGGLAFAPSAAFLASAGADATVRFWEVASGQELARLREEEGVRGVAYSPEGERVLTGTEGGYVSLWDVRRTKRLQDLKSEPLGPILKVAFSSTGDRALAAGRGGSGVALCGWDLYRRDNKVRYRDAVYHGGFRKFNDIAFSPCGTRCLAVGDAAKEPEPSDPQAFRWTTPICVVGLATGATTREFSAHCVIRRPGDGFAYSPATIQAAVEGFQDLVGRPVPSGRSVAIAHDGLRGLVGYSDGSVSYWGLA